MQYRTLKLVLTLCVAILSLPAFAGGDPEYQLFGYMFDWDDNVMRMPTTIVLINKTTGEELHISTEKFAEVKNIIGKPGEYDAYKIDFADPAKGSFRNFRDDADKNRFIKDLEKAIQEGNRGRDSLANFLFATSNPLTVRTTWINTSRGHEGESISRGTPLIGAQYPIPPSSLALKKTSVIAKQLSCLIA